MILNNKRKIVFNDLNKYYIVKEGFKYGADFILYKDNIKEHGFGLVFVKNDNVILDDKEKIIITRICENINKKGFIAFVNETTNTVTYQIIYRKFFF